MIELGFFLFGLGFSIFVCARSIAPSPLPPFRKALAAIITSIGITGMVTIIGVLIAPRIRSLF